MVAVLAEKGARIASYARSKLVEVSLVKGIINVIGIANNIETIGVEHKNAGRCWGLIAIVGDIEEAIGIVV